jgi:sulfur relay (sulfurtransferase) DsrC/TusE family protein
MSIEINDKVIETDFELFPHGPVRMLCKLAGLPKPAHEVET